MNDWTADEKRQNDFDDKLEAIRSEGAAAYFRGDPKTDNPYAGDPEPHFENAWMGGYAEAQLGFRTPDSPKPFK